MIAQTEIGTGPVLAEKIGEKRFYHWGNRLIGKPDIVAATEDFPSVTTILSMMDKPAIPPWTANTVAQYAMRTANSWQPKIEDQDWDQIETWTPRDMRKKHPEIFEIYDDLRQRPIRLRDRKGNRGSAVHEILDLAYGQGYSMKDAYQKVVGSTAFKGMKDEITDDITRPIVKFFQEQVVEMVAAEGTVYNTRHLYAGSFDAMCRMRDGGLAVIDYKTATNAYSNNALQLTAYSMCDKLAEPLKKDDPRRKQHIQENNLPPNTVVVELKDMPIPDYGIVAHIPGNQKATIYRTEFTKEQEQCVIGLRRLWEYVTKTRGKGSWATDITVYETEGEDL